MAYPTVSAPYGLQPVNEFTGTPHSGAFRQIPIASGYGTAIFCGDTVKLATTGYLVQDTGTDNATPVGVLVGVSYTDPTTKWPTYKQFLPAGIVASDIMGFVVDNPNTLFKVAVVSTGTTMATVGRAAVGANMALVQNAGSTITGNSKIAVLSTSADTTNTLPVRVIAVVPDTATGADAFPEVLVKINTHQYNTTTGV